MSDMARKNQRKSRRGCRRNKQSGGNIGAGYAVVPAPVDPTHPFIGNSARIDNITSCRAQTPDYMITPPPARGLPGMYGGKRRTTRRNRRAGRKSNKNMVGGRYGFDLTHEPVPNGAAGAQGGYPNVVKIGCEGTITNPLNMGPHTPSNPTPGAENPWSLGVSIAKGFGQGGGGGVPTGVMNPVGTGSPYLDLKAIPGTPGGTGSPFLTSPTAGYDNKPSTWTDSVGAPVQLQIPYNARIMNPACISTGGRRSRSTRRSQRKSRKNRKNTRKSRRNRRSNRR